MTGFLCVDKPEGRSSAFIVNVLKRVTKTPCGHMGTLDPFASGVLPVGLGNATRLFDFFLAKKKTYRAVFRFGATTDTLDPEGEIVCGGRIQRKERRGEEELRAREEGGNRPARSQKGEGGSLHAPWADGGGYL